MGEAHVGVFGWCAIKKIPIRGPNALCDHHKPIQATGPEPQRPLDERSSAMEQARDGLTCRYCDYNVDGHCATHAQAIPDPNSYTCAHYENEGDDIPF